MKIALLSFFEVANFGANLQLASTYNYLQKHGHDVVAINYESREKCFEKKIAVLKRKIMHKDMPPQRLEHRAFLDKYVSNQSPVLHSCNQVSEYIKKNGFDGIIIGSDAVAQHWPLFSTLKLGYHRPFWIEPLQQERRFPNPFWGIGFSDTIPTALLSVSSQNSKYHNFSSSVKKRMANQLATMKYITVRDGWTKDFFLFVNKSLDIEITPDPVFAFNQNLSDVIPSEECIRQKYKLPEKYVLIGLRSQVFDVGVLSRLNDCFSKYGKECVAFSIDGAYNYKHPFAYQIPLPISPIDWFALIKYASAYVGSNMHPIVSSLTNAVPCYSIDNWGMSDFFGHPCENTKASSKVYDLLSQYGLINYYSNILLDNGRIIPDKIVEMLEAFPQSTVSKISLCRMETYNQTLTRIINSFV